MCRWAHAFTPHRVALLELLEGQAAISLENTRLYADLQEREQRFRQVVHSNIVGIVFWDRDSHVFDANEAYLRMVGYTRQELLSGRVTRETLTPPEYREVDARAIEQLRRAGAAGTLSARRPTAL